MGLFLDPMNRQQRKHEAAQTSAGHVRGPPSAAAGPPNGPGAGLQEAMDHHRSGRLVEAEAAYGRLLERNPRDLNALHLLSLLALQTGRTEHAIALLKRALAVDDRQADLHAQLGRAHAAAGDMALAEAALRRAASLSPGVTDHSVELANLLLNLGRAGEAEALYRHAIASRPQEGGFANNLGAALRDLGRRAEATSWFHRALALGPAPEAFNNLAAVLNDQGQSGHAAHAAGLGLSLGADYADLHNNLGNALARLGRHGDAVAAFDQAIRREPGHAEAHNNRANALKELGRYDEALAGFRAALALRPGYGEARANLGTAIQATGRIAEAETHYLAALALSPDSGAVHNNLGTAMQAQGRMDEAAHCFARAVALVQDDDLAWSNWLFAIAFLPGYDDAAQFRENRAWGLRAERRATALPKLAHDRSPAPAPGRPLRIGYVSPDFREHVLLRAFEGVIAGHDRGDFELYCYADVAKPDEQTEALARRFDGWRNIHGMDDDARAWQIRADRIDILVCLSGYLARDRTLFARRVAPVQVAYANHVATTGLATMDYRISDPWLDPPDMTEAWNTERLVRLPGGYTSFSPETEAPDVTPLPALRNGYVTFGSFNNLAKLTIQALDLWSEILAALPDARLLLKAGGFSEPAVTARFRALLAERRVAPERVDLIGWVASKADNNRLYGRCDIALDPFPFNGSATSQGALWMGLPVVTLCGPSFVHRLGHSFLARAGLEHLVARTPDEYRRIALDLARDLEGLAALRAGMRERLAASPTFDHAGHARELEQAYRDMWRCWCEGGGSE